MTDDWIKKETMKRELFEARNHRQIWNELSDEAQDCG